MAASNSRTRAFVLECTTILPTGFQLNILWINLPKAFVIKTESDTGNGFVMFNHQIETILVIHDGS